MSYVISFFRGKFYKQVYKTTIFFLIIRGIVDFVMWIFVKSEYRAADFWAYVWLALLLFVMFFEAVDLLDTIQHVRNYYHEDWESRVEDRYHKAVAKYSNSSEKDFLFVIADGLHQKQSLRKINKFLKEKSNNFYSVTLSPSKKSDDYTLTLLKRRPTGITKNHINYTKDFVDLKYTAEKKIDSDLDKYLENTNGNDRKLLYSVLYALIWKSLSDVNRQMKHHPLVSHPKRLIQVNSCYKSEELGETLELQLLDNDQVVKSLEIFKNGFGS